MAVRLTGLVSNLDTETLVSELMKVQKGKKTKIEQNKTKLEWKEEKWKDINKKLYSLYNEKLSKLRLQGNYQVKAGSSSDESKAVITATNKAAAGSYQLQVNNLASSQYVTSADMKDKGWSGTTKLTEIFNTEANPALGGLAVGTRFTVKTGEGYSDISTFFVNEDTTIRDFTSFLSDAGLSASFDSNSGRFFISSPSTGTNGKFTLSSGLATIEEVTARSDIYTALDYDNMSAADKKAADKAINTLAASTDTEKLESAKETLSSLAEKYERGAYQTSLDSAIDDLKAAPDPVAAAAGMGLDALGLGEITQTEADNGLVGNSSSMSVRAASDSSIVLNGAVLTSSSNSYSLNGVNISLNGLTSGSEVVNLTVKNDTQAAYDLIKDFVKGYNEILGEMTTSYYAASAKGYDMLSSEDKEAMSDDEVKLWEDKIKSSLLKNDSQLNRIFTGIRSSLQSTVEIEGKSYSLSSFGIVTGNYDEYGLLHIAGDSEDGEYSGKADKLLSSFNGDLDTAVKALSGIFQQVYGKMGDMMKSSTVSSSMTFYNDKEIKKQYTEYDDQIKKMTIRLEDMEASYYKQFSAMEVSMQKLQQQQSQLAGLLGS